MSYFRKLVKKCQLIIHALLHLFNALLTDAIRHVQKVIKTDKRKFKL